MLFRVKRYVPVTGNEVDEDAVPVRHRSTTFPRAGARAIQFDALTVIIPWKIYVGASDHADYVEEAGQTEK